MIKQVKGFLKEVIEIITKPEMRVLPGQLAFFFVISLIPIVALIGVVASSFSISIDTLQEALMSAIPSDVSDMLITVVSGKGFNFNIAIFFISAFILASNGTHSMIITSNEIYKIKDSNIVRRRIKAIIMTFILVLLVFFLLLVPVFGDTIFEIMRNSLINQEMIDVLYNIYQILKYPVTIFLIYYNIKLLYVIAPDKKIRKSTATKGAIFTTISWIIATEVYSFYVGTFSKYDLFYGSISNLLILLLWVYILSYIFVLGMAINASNTKEEDIERTGMVLSNKKL